MSTLQQPAVYPPSLLKYPPDVEFAPETGDDSSESRSWCVVYTRAGQEKALARKLYANHLSFYLPLVPLEHVYHGKRVSSFIPLFSNYMFLFATESERTAALATNCVTRMLLVEDCQALYRDLLNIHSLIDAGATMTVEQHLQEGCRVRVNAGLAKGVEGVVADVCGEHRLHVAVSYIQHAVSVVLEDFSTEPVE